MGGMKREYKLLRRFSKENWRKHRRNAMLAWALVLALLIPLFAAPSAYAVEDVPGNETPADAAEPDNNEQTGGENTSGDHGSSDATVSDGGNDRFSEEELESGLCIHHPEHTDECGYMLPEGGSPCGHEHDDSCYRFSDEGKKPDEPEKPDDSNDSENTGDGSDETEVTEGSPCQHVHDENCGYRAPGETTEPEESETPGVSDDLDSSNDSENTGDESGEPEVSEGSPCNHVHDENCGYQAPGEIIKPENPDESGDSNEGDNIGEVEEPEKILDCKHEHDDTCGYEEPEGEGSPCLFECPFCIINWQWVDKEELLVWSEELKQWGLGMPGASEEEPVTKEVLEEMLPVSIDAETEAESSNIIDVVWDLDEFPEEGIFEGTYLLTAKLMEAQDGEGYAFAKDAPKLELLILNYSWHCTFPI